MTNNQLDLDLDNVNMSTTLPPISSATTTTFPSTYGQTLTTNTSNIYPQTYKISTGSAGSVGSAGQVLTINGTATFNDDIKIKGKSLSETLDKIEQRLAILRPNTELEKRWDELHDLRNRYVELERELIEKEKMWGILKK